MHLRTVNQDIVVLGGALEVLEYLNRRSANTSDRIQTPSITL